jgi:outer membrane protein TolC
MTPELNRTPAARALIEMLRRGMRGMTLSETQGNVSELLGEVDALQRARDLSEMAYAGGSITLTDVLDADRQLLTAPDQLESDKADAARAAVSTFRALGGGWRVPSVRSAAVQRN